MAEIEIGVMARQCQPQPASCGGRQQRGRLSATGTAYEWTGGSPPQMHAPN